MRLSGSEGAEKTGAEAGACREKRAEEGRVQPGAVGTGGGEKRTEAVE